MRNHDYCKRQFQLSMLRAHWWMASATSGHYKQRRIYHGTETSGRAEFTDDEKLRDCLATAQRHMELAQEFHEALGKENK